MIERVSIDSYNFYNSPSSDLLEFQKISYENFLKSNVDLNGFHKEISMESILRSAFPILDTFGAVAIEYVSHRLASPKYTEQECIDRGFTYSATLYVKLRMMCYAVDEESGVLEISTIKEQEVVLCDIPFMSRNIGSFILNGVQKVIVSQIHRSPGIFFDKDTQKSSIGYTASIIPYRGNWIDFEFDTKNVLYFRVNRKKKIHSSFLLSSFGFTSDQIIDTFCKTIDIMLDKGRILIDIKQFPKNITFDLYDENSELVVHAGTKFRNATHGKLGKVFLKKTDIIGMTVGKDITVEGIKVEASTVLTESVLEVLLKQSILLSIVDPSESHDLQIIQFIKKHIESTEKSMRHILRAVRPGIVIRDEDIVPAFNRLFCDQSSYDFSAVGRYKVNIEFGTKITSHSLTSDDVHNTIIKLLYIKLHNSPLQDLDSLRNRRVRGVGELFGNVFKISLGKLARSAVEKMNSGTPESLMPADVIMSSIVSGDVRDFFLLSQLSQFADQTNPLSEIVHKRRISALGPGGLNRERAGLEVRDVHYSHYGRICPIETPEGANIGLINTLALYAKINEFGFIATPFKKVVKGKIQDEIEYMDSIQEYNKTIMETDVSIIDFSTNTIKQGLIKCRVDGDFRMVPSDDVGYAEVNPKQIISVASSLVPFIESNDASRALMGANMQRQAVPLVHPKAPLIGTGMERDVISSTSVSIVADNDGVVYDISDRFIVVKTERIQKPCDIYSIRKFSRTNQSTAFNHNILVNIGQNIKKGDVLASGPSTQGSELAIGQNLLVAFSAWNGYNFEDAIVISEKVAKSDIFTSIHIEEFECIVRDTRLGAEEITRDVPNIPEEILAKLDESGVVNIGSYVEPGDILVGKVSPKNEDVLTAEEKLLKAIFGERNSRVRNSSLTLPPGISGTIVDVKIFTKGGVGKIERAKEIDNLQISQIKKEFDKRNELINETFSKALDSVISKSRVLSTHKSKSYNDKISLNELAKIHVKDKIKFVLDGEDSQVKINELKTLYTQQIDENKRDCESRIENIVNGNDLPNGVLMSVKVYVAIKRKLQPGDKMSGRHGNKGVVSIVLPVEDMPFLEDGTPVDIVLNPLGIANRMNIGQILEVHLGMAARSLGIKINTMLDENQSKDAIIKTLARVLGKKDDIQSLDNLSDENFVSTIRNWKNGVRIATSSFQSATDSQIGDILQALDLSVTGKFPLYDGVTGEKFDRDVAVGVMYMLKLHHLVEAKVHARSVGSYSLVTQQPLGGRSYFGGQRFGEMECWALQAYGAAYTLQEMLTVKSDDIQGRSAMYTSIVRGDYTFKHGTPESCNVMLKELRSLGLNVELEYDENNK